MPVKFLHNVESSGEVQGTSLDINGNADISGTLHVAGKIEHVGDSNTYFGFDLGNDTFRVVAGGTEKLKTASAGIEVNGELQADTLDIDGNADISGNITSAGWTGDVIASAYLDSDTMHLSVSQDITGHKEFQDNIQARFGNDQDLKIQHTGSHGYIDNETGNLYIRAEADDSHIYIQADNGSGANATYIDVDGNGGTVNFSKSIYMPDYIYHTGDGNTYFGFSGADTYKVFTGGAERLKVDSSGLTTGQNITASNIIVDDDGQIGSQSEPGAMEIDDGGTVSFNGGISVSGSIKSTIKTRVAAISSGTDADYKMGDVAYFGSTTSMDAGKIYYYTSSGTWALIDADAASTSTGMIGVALGAASNTNGVLLRGFVTLDHDPGSVGNALFLSTTAGTATSTAPSGSGDIVRVIGYCLHASTGQIYFNPDGTFVEVA